MNDDSSDDSQRRASEVDLEHEQAVQRNSDPVDSVAQARIQEKESTCDPDMDTDTEGTEQSTVPIPCCYFLSPSLYISKATPLNRKSPTSRTKIYFGKMDLLRSTLRKKQTERLSPDKQLLILHSKILVSLSPKAFLFESPKQKLPLV